MEVALFRSETMKNVPYSDISWQSDVKTWQSAIIEWRLIKRTNLLVQPHDIHAIVYPSLRNREIFLFVTANNVDYFR